MEYIIPVASAIVYDQLIEQEAYPIRVDHPNSHAVLSYREAEVFGTSSYSPTTEANALTQFAYYKSGGSKIKSRSGSVVWWWLRSVGYNNSSNFCAVDTSDSANYYYASSSHGVAPAFVFKEE